MRNKWIYTIVVLALGLFASCSDNMDESGTDGKSRKVVFRLSVSDANVGSRAAWSDGYTTSDADLPLDTHIEMNNLQVLVYNANNQFIGAADNVLYWAVSGDATATDNTKEEYEFVGDVSHLKLKEDGTQYKVMVLANSDLVSNNTDLGTHPYDIRKLATAIPMWGVKSLTLSSVERQELGTIDLLRAAAKVEVALDAAKMSNFRLKNITISDYNSRGYCVPADWDECTETKVLQQEVAQNTGELSTFNPHVSHATGLSVNGNDNAKSLKAYLPEYNNKHTSDHAATISVTLVHDNNTSNDLTDDKEFIYTNAIKFYDYNDTGSIDENTEEYNIVRNHHYKFTIIGVEGGLEIEYAVMDWTDAGTTDLATYEYPTYHNPIEAEPLPSGITTTIKRNPVMWYSADGSGDFWGYFYFEKGRVWTPTFLNTQDKYRIQVYGGDNYSDLLYDSKSTINTLNEDNCKGWFKIVVKPDNNVTSGTEVNLGITNTVGNLNTPFYLLINGNTQDDIRWPHSGTDPKFIQIETISELAIPACTMDNNSDNSDSFDSSVVPTMKTDKGTDGKYTDNHAFIAYFNWNEVSDFLYWVPVISDRDKYAVRVYKKNLTNSMYDTLVYSSYTEDGKNTNADLNTLITGIKHEDNTEELYYYQIKIFPISDYSTDKEIKLHINYDRGNNQPKQLQNIGDWNDNDSDVNMITIKHVNQ